MLIQIGYLGENYDKWVNIPQNTTNNISLAEKDGFI